jgi:6-pyruvoyltetrahydropterin/6-carboxytetrahydropterin synthase
VTYQVIKTYGHEQGLSCVFRQWRADSHCKQLHGYALAISMTFQADELDDRNWVIDFGSLKPVKEWLHEMFDHTLLLAADDPAFEDLYHLGALGLAKIHVVPKIGCEAFARMVWGYVDQWLMHANPKVKCVSVRVSEHAGNQASYMS